MNIGLKWPASAAHWLVPLLTSLNHEALDVSVKNNTFIILRQ
jgi:hypothetical protein